MKNELSTAWNPSSPPVAPPSEAPPLVQALKTYDQLQRRRYHVPAHAGFKLLPSEWDLAGDPYRYDLTELDGLDVLSEPSDSLLEAQTQIAKLFGVSRSFFLVNGASVGLMAAMLSVVKPGDTVLLPRNVHRSVLSGLILTGAKPAWFLPERLDDWGLWGGVTLEQVKAQLTQHPDAKALFVTSPTYEGIGSNVSALAEFCRERGISLVVDEAHGGLWPFSAGLPASAVHSKADVVIHSMHKSGGSLTQSALAHLPKGSSVDPAVFQQCLNTLQTTSPSYLLMASLEASCHALASPEGQNRINAILQEIHKLRLDLRRTLHHLELFEPAEADRAFWDPCKLYFKSPTESGEDWGAKLEEKQKLAYESASLHGVLYLANLGLQKDDFGYLESTLMTEDLAHRDEENQSTSRSHLQTALNDPTVLTPEMVMLPRDAFFAPDERCSVAQAVGRISKETVVHCPPGIPVLFPGERISAAHLPLLPEDGVLVVS